MVYLIQLLDQQFITQVAVQALETMLVAKQAETAEEEHQQLTWAYLELLELLTQAAVVVQV